MIKPTFRSVLLAAAVSLSTGIAAAQQQPGGRPNESWVTLNGTITNVTGQNFQLNYGDGVVTVEMDDWDNWNEAWGLKAGDEVIVTGRVDRDLFETTSIEASTVYVENLGTHFFASAKDDENLANWFGYRRPVAGEVTLRGHVTAVRAADGEFTINNGFTAIDVDVDRLGYNPFDEVGFQRIDVGDRVSVSGAFDRGLFEDRELIAQSVVSLERRRDSGGWRKSALTGAAGDGAGLPEHLKRVVADETYTTKDLVRAELSHQRDS